MVQKLRSNKIVENLCQLICDFISQMNGKIERNSNLYGRSNDYEISVMPETCQNDWSHRW